MVNNAEIEKRIKEILPENSPGRPFLCNGSPLNCQIAIIGINPATTTSIWPYWNAENGLNKSLWLEDYLRRHGRYKPTRDRLEVFCRSVSPLNVLELNSYDIQSKSEKDLLESDKDKKVFNLLLSLCRPKIIIVHGNTPARLMSVKFNCTTIRDEFIEVNVESNMTHVIQAKKHFSYVSRNYVKELGSKILRKIEEIG